MKLRELFESSDEDRAIISLSTAIYDHIEHYEYDFDDEAIYVGKIGDLFDTPFTVLNNVSIELQPAESMNPELNPTDADVGRWDNKTATILLNKDELGTNFLKTTISHELRHALDDYKSRAKTSLDKGRHVTPKNKAYRGVTNHPLLGDVSYIAQPVEINARYVQVMHDMVPLIGRAANLPTDQARSNIMRHLNRLLNRYHIAQLFPEKEKSNDYKRIIKRAVAFIDKELAYATFK